MQSDKTMTKVKYEKLPLLSRPDAQVQNRAAGKVYIFGADDIAEEEINTDQSNEMDELRPRGKAVQNRALDRTEDDFFIEKVIKKGETLHSIALKYGCPVCNYIHTTVVSRQSICLFTISY